MYQPPSLAVRRPVEDPADRQRIGRIEGGHAADSLASQGTAPGAVEAQLVAEVIRPALAAGRWVVCDRFLTATVVYQGHAGGLDPEAIRRVGAVATAGLEPDLEILLDIDAATARARLTRPLDKLESRGPAFRDRLVAGYRSEAARSPCCAVVDGRAPSADVGEAIRQVVATRLRADGGRRTVVGSGERPFPGHR